MNRLLLQGAILFTASQAIFAHDEDTRIGINKPSLHPVDQKIALDTFVPEFGYYFTNKASKENVVMGPCAPCVCMQICNPNNDECLYIHQHVLNNPQEPVRKVQEHFTSLDTDTKPDLDVTLFTNDSLANEYFPEGSHKKRIAKLADLLKENCAVQQELIYYNQTSAEEDMQQGNADRIALFKNKQPYRMNVEKQEGVKDLNALRDYRLRTYLDLMLRKKFANRVYFSHTESYRKTYNNPLCRIKKPNVTKINNLPPSSEDLLSRYNDLPPAKPVCAIGADWAYWLT